jgi:hypothetical protein
LPFKYTSGSRVTELLPRGTVAIQGSGGSGYTRSGQDLPNFSQAQGGPARQCATPNRLLGLFAGPARERYRFGSAVRATQIRMICTFKRASLGEFAPRS